MMSASGQEAQLPKKLQKDTILEAICELRFSSSQQSLSDILPGILYQNLAGEYPKSEKLPIGSLPAHILLADPDLKYKAITKLIGDKCSLLIGNHVLTVSKSRPYEGWDRFKQRINRVFEILNDTKLIMNVERVSLRYTNVLPTEQGMIGNELIQFNGSLGPYDLANEQTYIRTKIKRNDCLNIIQIRSHATVGSGPETLVRGILFDIDTLYNQNLSRFWIERDSILDKIHDTEKEIFFGSLTKNAIDDYGAVWG